jgi:dienelactone hydrolase
MPLLSTKLPTNIKSVLTLCAGALSLLICYPGAAQKPGTETKQKSMSTYYEEDVSTSNPLRTEQARELDAYISALKNDEKRLRTVFTPDYSSTHAYEASTKKLRQAFCDSIGYPPPGKPDAEAPDFKRIGEDTIGTYYRARIPVVMGVHAEGIYIVPKGLKGRAPLVISMHGGGGSPEVALFHGGANYHDMVRGGIKRGYIVFAPQHLFSAPGYPGDIRNRIDERMRLVGTSLTAVEIAKITRSLDVLLKRPEVDAKRVAMVGLSYGGYYALVTPAIDPRIKVAVSSCYFGVQEYRYARDENGVPSDFRFKDRFTLLRDPEIAALICPRALQIQAGANDDAEHRDMGIQLAPQVANYYNKLGVADNFKFLVFQGGHEFHDASAWEFVQKHL